MQTLSEIVSQIKQAVKIAAITPQNSEKKLRELVSPIWVNFLKEKCVDLNLQNVYLRIIRLFTVKVIDHRGNEVMVVRGIE